VELEDLALEVRKACREIGDPDLDDAFAHAYADANPMVDQERAARRRYLATMQEA
jgi:pyruvate dehydrogenase E1 component alpha subunit